MSQSSSGDHTRQPTIEGARAKLRRAEAHLDALHDELGAFLGPEPYRVAVENPREGEDAQIVLAEAPDQVPHETWALIVGDCVHNARCALDYIVWELAGVDITSIETQFPIFRSAAGWTARGKAKIAKLSPDAQAFIEALQPFHAQDPRAEILWALSTLDNLDKHKLLTFVTARQGWLRTSFSNVSPNPRFPPDVIWIPEAPLIRGTILATIPSRLSPRDVKVEAYLAVQVMFGQGLGFTTRGDVPGTLRLILDEVTQILTHFQKHYFQ